MSSEPLTDEQRDQAARLLPVALDTLRRTARSLPAKNHDLMEELHAAAVDALLRLVAAGHGHVRLVRVTVALAVRRRAGEKRHRPADAKPPDDDRKAKPPPPEPAAALAAKLRAAALLVRATPAERAVLVLAFGLDGNDPQPDDVIARQLGVVQESIRRTRLRALSRLRGPG